MQPRSRGWDWRLNSSRQERARDGVTEKTGRLGQSKKFGAGFVAKTCGPSCTYTSPPGLGLGYDYRRIRLIECTVRSTREEIQRRNPCNAGYP